MLYAYHYVKCRLLISGGNLVLGGNSHMRGITHAISQPHNPSVYAKNKKDSKVNNIFSLSFIRKHIGWFHKCSQMFTKKSFSRCIATSDTAAHVKPRLDAMHRQEKTTHFHRCNVSNNIITILTNNLVKLHKQLGDICFNISPQSLE